MLTQFFILTQFVSFDNFHFLISPVYILKLVDFDTICFVLFDNFHFLISPVYILKLVDFASADQDPRGR